MTQDAQDAQDAKTTSPTSGRNDATLDVGNIFADDYLYPLFTQASEILSFDATGKYLILA